MADLVLRLALPQFLNSDDTSYIELKRHLALGAVLIKCKIAHRRILYKGNTIPRPMCRTVSYILTCFHAGALAFRTNILNSCVFATDNLAMIVELPTRLRQILTDGNCAVAKIEKLRDRPTPSCDPSVASRCGRIC